MKNLPFRNSFFLISLFVVGAFESRAQEGHESHNFSTSQQSEGPTMRGLENIPDLDAWIKSFVPTTHAKRFPVTAREELEHFISEQGQKLNAARLYQFLLSHLKGPYQDHLQIEKLVETIYQVREHFRIQSKIDTRERRKIIQLLGLLGEEALAAAAAQRQNKNFIFEFNNPDLAAPKGKTVAFNKIVLSPGDVLLSKGGAGSSAFISRISDSGGNFSHATLAYLNPQGKLLLPESEIEDGNKLRDPNKDYIENRKIKLFVYRLKANSQNPESEKLAEKASQAIVQEMREKLDGDKSDEHLMRESAYPYDFNMDASDPSKLFCSELVMRAFQLAKVGRDNSMNPYANEVWSEISDPNLRDFFKSFLGIPSKSFPAPSDMEHNSQFALVGLQIDTAKLHSDRIDIAVIDTLIWLLNKDPQKSKRFLEVVKTRGNEILDPKKILSLADAGIISHETAQKLSLKIPPNITLKQAVFFAFLNDKLAPDIRKKVLADYPQSERVGPLELRKKVASLIDEEIKKFVAVLEKTQF